MGVDARSRVHKPAERLATILNEGLGLTTLTASDMERLVATSWDEISLYAHAVHKRLEEEKDKQEMRGLAELMSGQSRPKNPKPSRV